jgi:hypothetical protein
MATFQIKRTNSTSPNDNRLDGTVIYQDDNGEWARFRSGLFTTTDEAVIERLLAVCDRGDVDGHTMTQVDDTEDVA